jgi:hydrogenase maturation protease
MQLPLATVTAPVLVLGVGNLLLQDEGVGVRVVQELEKRYRVPAEVELLDGGTSGMELLDVMAGREHLIVVDAVHTGAAAGTVVELAGAEVPAFFRLRMSPHEIGLSDVLAALQITGETPRRISLIGVVPASTELSLELSPTVQAKFEPMLAAVVSRLGELGYRLAPAP